jgi:hypothetical protein
MAQVAGTQATQPWYKGLDRKQWNTLIASNFGWMFDGYETYALILTVGVAPLLRHLFPAWLSLPDAVPFP